MRMRLELLSQHSGSPSPLRTLSPALSHSHHVSYILHPTPASLGPRGSPHLGCRCSPCFRSPGDRFLFQAQLSGLPPGGTRPGRPSSLPPLGSQPFVQTSWARGAHRIRAKAPAASHSRHITCAFQDTENKCKEDVCTASPLELLLSVRCR